MTKVAPLNNTLDIHILCLMKDDRIMADSIIYKPNDDEKLQALFHYKTNMYKTKIPVTMIPNDLTNPAMEQFITDIKEKYSNKIFERRINTNMNPIIEYLMLMDQLVPLIENPANKSNPAKNVTQVEEFSTQVDTNEVNLDNLTCVVKKETIVTKSNMGKTIIAASSRGQVQPADLENPDITYSLKGISPVLSFQPGDAVLFVSGAGTDDQEVTLEKNNILFTWFPYRSEGFLSDVFSAIRNIRRVSKTDRQPIEGQKQRMSRLASKIKILVNILWVKNLHILCCSHGSVLTYGAIHNLKIEGQDLSKVKIAALGSPVVLPTNLVPSCFNIYHERDPWLKTFSRIGNIPKYRNKESDITVSDNCRIIHKNNLTQLTLLGNRLCGYGEKFGGIKEMLSYIVKTLPSIWFHVDPRLYYPIYDVKSLNVITEIIDDYAVLYDYEKKKHYLNNYNASVIDATIISNNAAKKYESINIWRKRSIVTKKPVNVVGGTIRKQKM